ncbi:MAG TPA: hypothetical protein VGJ95_14430 [Pseudonocardiaceae bacterium]|jgi:hypothetical protein
MDYPTQQLPPQPPEPPAQPPGQPTGRRRAWLLPAAVGALLLVGVLTAAVVIAGPLSPSRGAGNATADTAGDAASLDALLEPAADPSDLPALPEAKDRPFRHGHKGFGPWRLREGEKVVAGTVSSVADGKLVVRKDNGAEVTVPTDSDTKVRGAQNRSLSDLQAGERVIVKVGTDGVANGVLAVKAHAAGTVTKVDGDRATVVSPGGLTTVLDLSGVSQRPAVGTIVVAVGTATDDGATLKVEQIRELPTLG